MKTSRARGTKPSITLALLAVSAAGCALDLEEPAELETRTQGIENGELRPSVMNGGTVQLTIYGPDGINSCSGQVVSRDALLTAAHCFYDVGVYDGGYDSEVEVSVMVQHQNADASWEFLSLLAEPSAVHIKSSYYNFRTQGSNRQWGHDIAVVRRSTPWMNTVSSDVSALAADINDRPGNSYVYGHGYFSDMECDKGFCNEYEDDELRRGYLTGLSWIFPSNTSANYYGTVYSDYGSSSPHTCKGDSGGPWKNVIKSPTNASGVQFGVHVAGSPDGECADDWALAASVANSVSWIESKIELGAGTCAAPKTLAVYYSSGPYATYTDAIQCW